MGRLDNSPTIQITGTIMVIAIVVLFLVVVFIIFLHLYAKWFWWQMEEPTPPPPPAASSRRRRRRRPLVFSPGQDIPLRTGLDLTVLRSLPIIIFQSKDFKEGLECAVCLCEVEEGEKARLLPKCNHGFHVDCIDMWFQSHSTCPLCRSKVAPLLPPQNGGSSASDDHNQNGGLEEGNGQPLEDLSSSGHSTESASFPTNVLVWGDQDQVSTTAGGNGCLELGEGTSAQLDSRSSSLSASSSNLDAVLVIDIPDQAGENMAEEESNKSPVPPTRLRSFRRLLSREKRVAPFCSSSSDEVQTDYEFGR